MTASLLVPLRPSVVVRSPGNSIAFGLFTLHSALRTREVSPRKLEG